MDVALLSETVAETQNHQKESVPKGHEVTLPPIFTVLGSCESRWLRFNLLCFQASRFKSCPSNFPLTYSRAS